MPTYRSCGDRFLGRWKRGEREIEAEESGRTEEYERAGGEEGKTLIFSAFLFRTVSFVRDSTLCDRSPRVSGDCPALTRVFVQGTRLVAL